MGREFLFELVEVATTRSKGFGKELSSIVVMYVNLHNCI